MSDVSWTLAHALFEVAKRGCTHVNTKGDVAVAAVRLELVGNQLQRNKGNVRVVHGLKGLTVSGAQLQRTHDSLIRAVEVTVSDELLDSWVLSATGLSGVASMGPVGKIKIDFCRPNNAHPHPIALIRRHTIKELLEHGCLLDTSLEHGRWL